jgi:hypothetical protein
MAALNDIKAQVHGQFQVSGLTITANVWDELKPIIAHFFWAWFDSHLETTLLKKGFWFIKFTLKVQDLEKLFEMLFGDRPEIVPVSGDPIL